MEIKTRHRASSSSRLGEGIANNVAGVQSGIRIVMALTVGARISQRQDRMQVSVRKEDFDHMSGVVGISTLHK
jgi:hypothetical protein